ncbi:MAG: Asp23/Gls24 family envelope stress response protein, partial [Anaerolineae bacterium]
MDESLGKVTIAPNVLVTIVQKTASSTPGVAKLCSNVTGVKRLLGLHTVGPGVEVSVEDDWVGVDVYLVAKRDIDLLQMGRQLQHEVTRAIQDIVGMEVRQV